MIGKKLQNQYPKSNINQKYQKNPYKIYNKEISPHLNVLQFDMYSNINNNNNFGKNKNIRNLSQKPIRKQNIKINPNVQNIQNNNYYFNNINNNFIIKNSYPLENQNFNNKNMYNNIKSNKKISQRQIKPLNINNSKNIKNQSRRYDYNNKNNKNKVKIKIDQKGVYISNEEDVYEDPNDPVNKLNSLLDYKQKNKLEMSQEEKNMIETIKKVSSNRVQYRNTHQMLKEIGKIMKDPVVSFLIKKDPAIENKEENPSDKLSEMISQKMLEEHRQKMKEKKEEDLYYEQLQKRIKDEIRNKGSFDFAKLPDKDRQMLAQRKVYNKIGLKVYENYANDNKDVDNNIIKDKNKNEENIDEKIDNQIKNEINREKKKEEFLNDLEKYKEKYEEEDDDYFKYGEINNNKKIKEYNNEDINYNYEDNDINKGKPTARGILEKVLGKIEYKNEQLINHNPIKEVINNKKENTKKKNFN